MEKSAGKEPQPPDGKRKLITPVGGSWRPSPIQVPPNWPMSYPNFLIPTTEVIVGRGVKKFPVQTQTLQLCKYVIARLTPLVCGAVQNKTLRTDLALSTMGDLLDSVFVHNCHDSERSVLGQELRKSDEWQRFAKKIARHAADSLRPNSDDEVWNQIDHELVRHKLSLLSKEMQEKSASEERRVLLEADHKGNSGAAVPMLITMHEGLTDEWVGRYYQAYCETWTTQGKVKSAEFVRAVFHKALVPLIAVRKAAIFGDLELMSVRTRKKQFSDGERELARTLKTLQGNWSDKLEIEARECEHVKQTTGIVGESTAANLNNYMSDAEAVIFHLEQAAARAGASLGKQLLGLPQSPAHPQQNPPLALTKTHESASASEITDVATALGVQFTGAQPKSRQGDQVQKRRGKGRPPSVLVANRRKIISKIAETGVEGEQYCQKVDATGLSTPPDWQKREGCPKKYVDAWNHPRDSAKWRHRIADEKTKATSASRKNSPAR